MDWSDETKGIMMCIPRSPSRDPQKHDYKAFTESLQKYVCPKERQCTCMSELQNLKRKPEKMRSEVAGTIKTTTVSEQVDFLD